MKLNEGDWLYFAALGMWICCVVFWLSGAKELANELTVYAVVIGLGGIGISKLKRSAEKTANGD